MYNVILLVVTFLAPSPRNCYGLSESALQLSPLRNSSNAARIQFGKGAFQKPAPRETPGGFLLKRLQPLIPHEDMGTSIALALAVCSMLFWGSWANTLLLAKVRFELFFLNYMFGNAAAVLVMALIMKPPTLDNIPYGHGNAVALSVIAGIFYAAGTMAATNAIGLAGISLAVPVVMGMEFSLGVPLMLLVEGFGVPAHWGLSFAGVGAVLCAVALDAIAHRRLTTEQHDEYDVNVSTTLRSRSISASGSSSASSHAPKKFSETHPLIDRRDDPQIRHKIIRSRAGEVTKVQAVPKGRTFRSSSGLSLGTAVPNEPLERIDVFERQLTAEAGQRKGNGPELSKERPSTDRETGLALAVLAGLCFACWPCLASIVEGRCVNCLRAFQPISFATFYMVFIVSAFCWAICMLPYLSLHPVGKQEPLDFWASYSRQPIPTHALGILGGLLQGVGTVLSLQAGSVLGNAVSMSITRCSPVVAALWGWLYWGELHGASIVTRCIYFAMIIAFLVAVALLGWASSFSLDGVDDSGDALPFLLNSTGTYDDYLQGFF